MPLSLLNHSALALFAQRTRIPTSARSIGFCAIWVCISSSSSYCIVGCRSGGILADLTGGKAPYRSFWNAQIKYDSRNMGNMPVLFDLELRMAITT